MLEWSRGGFNFVFPCQVPGTAAMIDAVLGCSRTHALSTAMAVPDAAGSAASVGVSEAHWLCSDDFVSSDEGGFFDVDALKGLGFPREWPQVYTSSAALKSLLGKRGRIPAKRVAVAGSPTSEQLAKLPKELQKDCIPLHSFGNAELMAQRAGLHVVKGWAVFERLDKGPGASFVAERYWWNSFPEGTWIDVTPRPRSWQQLLLAEPLEEAVPKTKTVLNKDVAQLLSQLLAQRYPEYIPRPVPQGPQVKEIKTKEVKTDAKAKPTPEHGTKDSVKKQSGYVASERGTQRNGVDYSKFDHIEDSDDEKLVPKQTLTLPMGLPREAVSRQDYDNVWRALLQDKRLPFTPAPDLDQMWGYYKQLADRYTIRYSIRLYYTVLYATHYILCYILYSTIC